MSDRLNDLQRQLALVQEQLAWLEREIAKEKGGQAPAPFPSAPAPVPTQASGAVSAPAPKSPLTQKEVDVEAARILAQYQTRGRSPQDEVKHGCIVYFLVAMTVLVLAIGGWMMLKYLK